MKILSGIHTWVLLGFPAAFIAGWKLTEYLVLEERCSVKYLLTFSFPLIAGIFWALGTGGRQILGIILLYYFAGISLSLSIQIRSGLVIRAKRLFQMACGSIFFITSFAFFVSYTGLIRRSYFQSAASDFDVYPIIRHFSQFIEYMGSTIAAFQYKVPFISDVWIDAGKHTFNVIRFFFLDKLLGWEIIKSSDIIGEAQELARQGYRFTYSPATIFLDIYMDFSFWPGIFALFLLVVISNIIFLKFFVLDKVFYLTTFVPIIITLMFWGHSHQFSILKNDVLIWMLVSFVIWDIIAWLRNVILRCEIK